MILEQKNRAATFRVLLAPFLLLGPLIWVAFQPTDGEGDEIFTRLLVVLGIVHFQGAWVLSKVAFHLKMIWVVFMVLFLWCLIAELINSSIL